MSLLDDAYEPCIMLDKTTGTSDYGGIAELWQDGAPFEAAIVFDSSIEARVAAINGVVDNYTIITHRDVVLNANDVFRRVKNGQIFRVTTNGADNETPPSAGLDMRAVKAKLWSLTNG